MEEFVVQELNCNSYNFYSLVGETQPTMPETCVEPMQCSAGNVLHFNNAKENGIFSGSIGAQEVNISPPGTNIGRRHFSYVPEAVQLEVDGINTQELAESQPLKDSSSASLPEDIEKIIADLITEREEMPFSMDIGLDTGVNTDHSIHLPNSEICNLELADVTGCSNSLFCSPIPGKEAYPNSVLAVAQSGPPNTVKRKAHLHGNKDEAPKRKRLWQEGPFADKVKEKKRKDALRAKKNRDLNKERSSRFQEKEKELAECRLKLEEYKLKCEALEKIVGEFLTEKNYSPAHVLAMPKKLTAVDQMHCACN